MSVQVKQAGMLRGVERLPAGYFKTDRVIEKGSRDKRGRFMAPKVVLKQCKPSEAEYATGVIWVPDNFNQVTQGIAVCIKVAH